MEHVEAYQSIYKGLNIGILNTTRLLMSLNPHKKFEQNNDDEENIGHDSANNHILTWSSFTARISAYFAGNKVGTTFEVKEKEITLIANLEEQSNIPHTSKEVVLIEELDDIETIQSENQKNSHGMKYLIIFCMIPLQELKIVGLIK